MRLDSFTGPAYKLQSVIASSDEQINWYSSLIESGQGKNPKYTMDPTPGVRPVVEFPQVNCRGCFALSGRMYTVIGPRAYEFDADLGTYTELGTVAVDTNPATFASNGPAGNQIIICSGDRVYLFNTSTNVFTAGPVVSDVTMVGFLDGYFYGLDATTGTLKQSAFLDGSTWPASHIAQRNTAADPWIGMRIADRLVHLWGRDTSEAWYGAGLSPFVLTPALESFAQVGIPASFACADVGGLVPFLGQSAEGRGIVWRWRGYARERISDHGVEAAIGAMTTVSDVVVYGYEDQGHPFTVFTFPTENQTWVYDDATKGWHRRGFWNTNLMRFDASRQLWHCYAQNKHLVGDRIGSSIYEQSVTLRTDVNNSAIRRLRRSPHLNRENDFVGISELTCDLETGIGLVAGQGVDPMMMWRFSRDGGRVYGEEHQVSAGKMGAYGQRVVLRRLGRARDWVMELTVSDPVPWRVTNLYLEAA